jgi:signal peptide peptidase SppA
MRELAMAVHNNSLASDLRALATANMEAAQAAFMDRRNELVAAYGFNPAEQRKPFAFSNGVAIIPVHGTLINRFAYSWGYVTGYNFIRQQTALAGQDPDVTAIVFDINSYGGEAAGCFECAADIKSLANGKPTMASVDSNAYSGGYAIASGAGRISLTPSGGVGSIGVVVTHVSYEKMLDEAGIKVSFIHAGKHKVDGNPYEDLSDDVRADIQKGVDATYDQFVSLVQAGRKSKMSDKAIRATEARIYRAEDALSLGLIDAIAAPSEAMRAFMGELSGSNPQPRKKEDAMSDAAKPGDTKAAQEEMAKAQADAAKAERARVSGIQSCDEAKGREALASHLAFNTDMTVDAAKAILAAAPKADAAAHKAGEGFQAAMNAGQHPNVGADGGQGGDDGTKPNRVATLLTNARAAGVRGYEQPKK